jgi:tetratricopeptide (TPR) repeat protein
LVILDDGQTLITVTLFLDLSPGDERFVFPQPGDYDLQWMIYLENVDEPLRAKQLLSVGAVSPDDLSALKWLSDTERFLDLVGPSLSEELPLEYRNWLLSADAWKLRAMGILRILMQPIVNAEPYDHLADDENRLQNFVKVLDAARVEFANSRLAPYFAFAAGAARTTLISEHVLRRTGHDAGLQETEEFGEAVACLDQAIRGSSESVATRAVLQKGRLYAQADLLDEAEELIEQAAGKCIARSVGGSISRELRRSVSAMRTRNRQGE